MDDTQKTAAFIKRKRQEFRVTQEQFSKMFKCARSEVSRYENGRIQAPGSLILRILEYEKKQIKRAEKWGKSIKNES